MLAVTGGVWLARPRWACPRSPRPAGPAWAQAPCEALRSPWWLDWASREGRVGWAVWAGEGGRGGQTIEAIHLLPAEPRSRGSPVIDGAGARGPAVPWSRTPCRACWAVCKHSLSLVVHPPHSPIHFLRFALHREAPGSGDRPPPPPESQYQLLLILVKDKRRPFLPTCSASVAT